MSNDRVHSYLVINRIRGFLCETFSFINSSFDNINIKFSPGNSYEKSGIVHHLLHNVISWKIFDYLGVFQVLKFKNTQDETGLISYNRLVRTKSPYIIVLENPYALVNYADQRMNHLISRIRLNHYLNSPYLKGIVCISKACAGSFTQIYASSRVKIAQVYPLIPNGRLNKNWDGAVKCLYVSSDFYLKGGKEILTAFSNIYKSYTTDDISLTIVTPINKLDKEAKKIISSLNIRLMDYAIDKTGMHQLYDENHVLLNPTRMDSFSLVTLESMKYGCVYVGTDLYAIPEMVKPGINGFLTASKFSPWRDDNKFDHYKHKRMKELSKPSLFDEALSGFLKEKLELLIQDRSLLKGMSNSSFQIANSGVFDESSVCTLWYSTIDSIFEDE